MILPMRWFIITIIILPLNLLFLQLIVFLAGEAQLRAKTPVLSVRLLPPPPPAALIPAPVVDTKMHQPAPEEITTPPQTTALIEEPTLTETPVVEEIPPQVEELLPQVAHLTPPPPVVTAAKPAPKPKPKPQKIPAPPPSKVTATKVSETKATNVSEPKVTDSVATVTPPPVSMSAPPPQLPTILETKNAHALHRPEPPYPRQAQRRGIEGEVYLELLIDTDGSVKQVQIIRANPPGIFEDHVLTTVRQWRFSPAHINGQAVQQRTQQRLAFALK
jgi:TonB family protein